MWEDFCNRALFVAMWELIRHHMWQCENKWSTFVAKINFLKGHQILQRDSHNVGENFPHHLWHWYSHIVAYKFPHSFKSLCELASLPEPLNNALDIPKIHLLEGHHLWHRYSHVVADNVSHLPDVGRFLQQGTICGNVRTNWQDRWPCYDGKKGISD